jgi:hypothetical protein
MSHRDQEFLSLQQKTETEPDFDMSEEFLFVQWATFKENSTMNIALPKQNV